MSSTFSSATALAYTIAQEYQPRQQACCIITTSTLEAEKLFYALRFFIPKQEVHLFSDWETLAYDRFSPSQEITSERIHLLHLLQSTQKYLVIITIQNLLHQLAPPEFITRYRFDLKIKDTLDREAFKKRLTESGYQIVQQVLEAGDLAFRGALLDVFPMGYPHPFRVELFDEEIHSIRYFEIETQRSIENVEQIHLMPAHEFPLDEASIQLFRQRFREAFPERGKHCSLYENVSQGLAAGGIEYFLPLFFEKSASFFDYLPKDTLIYYQHNAHDQAQTTWREIQKRYENLRYDLNYPILPPTEIFWRPEEVYQKMRAYDHRKFILEEQPSPYPLPPVGEGTISDTLPQGGERTIHPSPSNPLEKLKAFLKPCNKRMLFCAETKGRREVLLDLFKAIHCQPHLVNDWSDFLASNEAICLTVYPLDDGMISEEASFVIISENQIFGNRVLQRRLRKKHAPLVDASLRDLSELKIGDPVVHIHHGVGRYLGLEIINYEGESDEFLKLEYANDAKLYILVSDLQLISRYTGGDPASAPLHHLGSEHWQKAKRKAAEKIKDVAAELLSIYAKRQAAVGFAYPLPEAEYRSFSEAFPFEETPDQDQAIQAVLKDMHSPRPMDRLICGDVGFGKTEVAMRATFIAAINQKQVAILAPTTLLAQQHYENFKDRFADWPLTVEVLSRFRSQKQIAEVMRKLEEGKVDIVIGTHKLLNPAIRFKDLGLVVIDEEHRFGVAHKEHLKSLRAQVDILTLTATPIPRTLNLAFANIRDFSIIATPPAKRLAIKTFIQKFEKNLVREAILREISRGGQVYFIHNRVETIDKMAAELSSLVPEARMVTAHGQMHERELERIMADFYHRKYHVLIATTIIESGIDIPSANTIIINQAHQLGLAQLHQLRGRVGRSHHQAYAYFLVNEEAAMTMDAKKRLEAIESLGDLGLGFSLASHDLEIRGAGEILGEAQSGQMEEVGFHLYMEMLEKAVKALKLGRALDLSAPETSLILDLPHRGFIPETYVMDINQRLVLYKRLSMAESSETLEALKVELIDRFGLLPPLVEQLFSTQMISMQARRLGILKIQSKKQHLICEFDATQMAHPERIIAAVKAAPQQYQFSGSQSVLIQKTDNTSDFDLLQGFFTRIS